MTLFSFEPGHPRSRTAEFFSCPSRCVTTGDVVTPRVRNGSTRGCRRCGWTTRLMPRVSGWLRRRSSSTRRFRFEPGEDLPGRGIAGRDLDETARVLDGRGNPSALLLECGERVENLPVVRVGLEGPIEDPNRGIDLAAALESDTVNVSVPSFAGLKPRGPPEGVMCLAGWWQSYGREAERVVELRGL